MQPLLFYSESAEKADFSFVEPNVEALEGYRVEVYWPLGNEYYRGTIASLNDDGLTNVLYDGHETESSNMVSET